VAPAVEVWLGAVADLRVRLRLPGRDATSADRARLAGRIDHLRTTDPEGSWAADRGGRLVGLVQSFVRESYWVLSLLGVEPAFQSSGVGRALLERALAHGNGKGTIQASQDPRAVRLYATAGFELHPSMDASGTLRPDRPAAPPTVRTGGVDDLALADAVDRAVRGSARTADLLHELERNSSTLLLDGDRAYAVATPSRVVTLAGRDEGAAAGVLAAAFDLAPPGGVYEVGWITAPQQWAVRATLAAGLSLHPRGPVMVRGMDGPPAPYLPSGGLG
jgi:GNAT superfamily N-acetyltransferase